MQNIPLYPPRNPSSKSAFSYEAQTFKMFSALDSIFEEEGYIFCEEGYVFERKGGLLNYDQKKDENISETLSITVFKDW